MAAESRAQGTQYAGQWTQAFNHEVGPSSNATNPFAPFPGYALDLPPYAFEIPFGSVHMSLIPRGKDRGKVIVWNRPKFQLTSNGAFNDGGHSWSYQCWAIVDPGVAPVGPRFRNFLLPLHPVVIQPQPGSVAAENLFCAGHCWSPWGDLVVAGGETTGAAGSTFVLLYRPDEVGQPFPIFNAGNGRWDNDFTGTGVPIYGGAHGEWIYGPTLTEERYYPTLTMSSRLTRTGSKEVVLVMGGTDDLTAPTSPTWNSYEGLVLENPNVQATRVGLTKDQYLGFTVFGGPEDLSPLNLHPMDFENYPRVHWLSTGYAFMSGYDEMSAKTQHEIPPTIPGQWNYQSGQFSNGMTTTPPSWVERHDGASVMFAHYGGLTNFVARIGGFNGNPFQVGVVATRTVEFMPDGSAPNSGWNQGPSMNEARGWLNAVILPDASVLALGGLDDATLSNPNWPVIARGGELFKSGQWWKASPMQTLRGYHATAVLLPDGRVLIGGGEGRHLVGGAFDYEVYSPWYMSAPRPVISAVSQATNLGSNADGSVRVRYGFPISTAMALPALTTGGKAVLMSPGSMTHHSDMHARYIELEKVDASHDPATGLTTMVYDMPIETVAPRGYYMLFALTDGGVPSEAAWIQITQ